MWGSKLSMQLVPSQAHGRNLRAILKPKSWTALSRAVRDRDKLCECGAPSKHCHEVWEWVVSEGKLVQRLIGLEGVCVECHDFMHYGRIAVTGTFTRQNVVLGHAMDVLGMGSTAMMDYIGRCFAAHQALSRLPLKEDMDLRWCFETPELGLGLGPDLDPILAELTDYVTQGECEYIKEAGL